MWTVSAPLAATELNIYTADNALQRLSLLDQQKKKDEKKTKKS